MDQRQANELVDELRGAPDDPLHRSMGIIVAADTTALTCTIVFSSGAQVSGISYLDHVTPTVGYTAWMLELGGDYLVIGTTH